MTTSSGRGNKVIEQLFTAGKCASPVVVIVPDAVRRERFWDELLREIFTGSSPPAGGVRRVAGDDLDGPELRKLEVELFSPSLFSTQRVVRIDCVDELAAAPLKELRELLKRPAAGITAVCTAKKLAASHPLRKDAAAAGALVELKPLEGADLKRWTERELRREGVPSTEPAVIDMVIAASDESPDEIVHRVRQLAVYLDGEPATAAAFSQLFSCAADPNQFALLDHIARGRSREAELLVGELLRAGESPFALLGLLNRGLTNYLLVRQQLGAGKSQTEVREPMRQNNWIFQRTMEGAKLYTTAGLREKLGTLLHADSLLKNRSLGPEMIFSGLVRSLGP